MHLSKERMEVLENENFHVTALNDHNIFLKDEMAFWLVHEPTGRKFRFDLCEGLKKSVLYDVYVAEMEEIPLMMVDSAFDALILENRGLDESVEMLAQVLEQKKAEKGSDEGIYPMVEVGSDAGIYLIEVGYLLTEDEERLPYSGVYDRNYGYCNDGFYGGGEWYCVGLSEAKEQALKEIEGMSEDAYVVLSKAENLGYEQIKGVDESHQPYDKDGEPFEDMERHLPQNVVYSARKHGGCLEENFVDTTPLEQELLEEAER